MVLSQGEPLSPQEQMIMEESVEVEINNLMSVYRTLAKSDDLDGLASLTEEEISQYLELLLGPEINDELWENKKIEVLPGVEPGFQDSESCVLPLHHRTGAGSPPSFSSFKRLWDSAIRLEIRRQKVGEHSYELAKFGLFLLNKYKRAK